VSQQSYDKWEATIKNAILLGKPPVFETIEEKIENQRIVCNEQRVININLKILLDLKDKIKEQTGFDFYDFDASWKPLEYNMLVAFRNDAGERLILNMSRTELFSLKKLIEDIKERRVAA
jgi:hypothetical protein